ncbi:MAG: hypothetical protein ABR606_03675 [Vicinamibacterales bacterium]
MFASLHAPLSPAADLVSVAQAFTPRFQMMSDVLVLDVSGLARLFGGPVEIGEYLHRAAAACARDVQVAVAPTATAATLLALGHSCLSVVTKRDMAAALARLPLSVLGEYERIRMLSAHHHSECLPRPNGAGEETSPPPAMRAKAKNGSAADTPAAGRGPGWAHPRTTHEAQRLRLNPRPPGVASPQAKAESLEVQATLDLLARWGLTTLGALERLPMADVAERLGDRGTRWQRVARGEDQQPLVPWVPEEPFEASIELEWPIEGLDPLSFVLTRLLEPLADRLERADRGAAVVHLRLRLVNKAIHARHLQLPAPTREPKTLRTLLLLDLESHPPSAAIDRVGVLVEPTPGRVLQWMLFERAQPSPEQVSTLLARLTALMGEGHVGSPALVDSWRPGGFALKAFEVQSAEGRVQSQCRVQSAECRVDAFASTTLNSELCSLHSVLRTLHSAVRRYRLPVAARVRVHEGRPVRVQVDRRGLTSGAIVEAAGPWRTSGEWWQAGQVRPVGRVGPVGKSDQPYQPDPSYQAHPPHQPWDRDEWDVALGDGTIYRLFVERDVGQWFVEGVID